MESKDELKEIDFKNRTCCYFDDTMRVRDISFDNILSNKKSHKKPLIYDVSYKTFIGKKPLGSIK